MAARYAAKRSILRTSHSAAAAARIAICCNGWARATAFLPDPPRKAGWTRLGTTIKSPLPVITGDYPPAMPDGPE